MQNDQVLVIAENEEVEAEDTLLLAKAGFPREGITTAKGEDALDFINSRLLHDRHSQRPGLIIFDLDHASGKGRERLKRLMMLLKGTEEFARLPLVMLVRPDYVREDVHAWYREGVNAVALRPNGSGDDALKLFQSLCAFWRAQAMLPDVCWNHDGEPLAY